MLGLIACTFKPVVEGDGIGYYSYLHTILVDHDLDLGNEYAAAGAAHATVDAAHVTTRTATGLLADFFPAGPALMAAPAYAAALLDHPDGNPLFGPPFTFAYVWASLLFGLLALVLAFRLALEVTGDRRAALIGAAAAAVATPFLYYAVYEPSYSHTFSAFATAAFLLAWRHARARPALGRYAGVGALGGLMALTRYQDGLLLVVLLLDLPRAGRHLVPAAAAAAAVFAPQLVIEHAIFGSWLPVRPEGQELRLWPGHYLEVLLSSRRGLFVWHPAFLVAAAGIALARDRAIGLAAALGFAMETAVNGSAPDWDAGFAFGMRRFLDLTPFVAVGLAEVARRLGARRATLATALLGAWTMLLAANLTYVTNLSDPGYEGLLRNQALALRRLPNMLVQGFVIRAALPPGLLRDRPSAAAAAELLTFQALAVAVAGWLLARLDRWPVKPAIGVQSRRDQRQPAPADEQDAHDHQDRA